MKRFALVASVVFVAACGAKEETQTVDTASAPAMAPAPTAASDSATDSTATQDSTADSTKR